jgi:putative transposase
MGMNRRIAFAEGEFYHVFNRGTDKRVIFLDRFDYDRFSKLLFFCNGTQPVQMAKLLRKLGQGETLTTYEPLRGEPLVDIGAYCLMDNHFHLLVRQRAKDGLSLFLRKVGTAYSMYFNIKNSRTGGLFEGAFQARHATSDEYLKYLFSYIHLNPVKIIDPEWKENGLKDLEHARSFVEEYPFSSYKDYLDPSRANPVLNKQAFPEYFLEHGMREEVEGWLNFTPDHLVKVSP